MATFYNHKFHKTILLERDMSTSDIDMIIEVKRILMEQFNNIIPFQQSFKNESGKKQLYTYIFN